MKNLFAVTTLAFVLTFSAATADAAELTVVHGITGADLGLDNALPVDIAIDGACTVPDARLGDVAGPLSVDPGTYFVEIFLADAMNPCGGALVISDFVSVRFGEDLTVVAHLTTDGTITASKFVNDVRTLGGGEGRVIVRHLADAPAVDVWVKARSGGAPIPLFTNLTNPDQGKAIVAADDYGAIIAPAGVLEAAFGPVPLAVGANATTIVYAVGTLDSGTFTVIAQVISL